MKFDRYARRKMFTRVMTVLTGLTIAVIMIPLISVIYQAVSAGYSALTPGFFTQSFPLACSSPPATSCPTGGIAPAIQGTFLLLGMSSLIALPIGIAAAIFVVEFGGQTLLARAISTVSDVLSGVPSILAGVFAYSLFLQYDRQLVFSTYSESIALGILMIPIVARTAEEALRTVPRATREAALALGIPRWKASTRITLVSALPGVITGAILAVARAAGESAPILFTSVFSLHGFTGFNQSVDTMALWIYIGAESGYSNWVALAWGTALLLILIILGLALASRYAFDVMLKRMRGG